MLISSSDDRIRSFMADTKDEEGDEIIFKKWININLIESTIVLVFICFAK